MCTKLRHLRDAVPRLIDPMLIQQPSPEDLYATFATNVTAIRSDAKGFSKNVQDDRYAGIFKKAEESMAVSGEAVPGWRVVEHEDWLNVHNVDSPMDIGANGAKAPNQDIPQKPETDTACLRTAMEKFRKSSHNLEGSLDEDSGVIMVWNTPTCVYEKTS